MTRSEKLTSSIKKLFKICFDNDLKVINVSVDKNNRIVIVYKEIESLGIFSSIVLDNTIGKRLEDVLNLQSWQYRLIKKYDDGPEF